jgi:HK97 family phage major capsid protein
MEKLKQLQDKRLELANAIKAFAAAETAKGEEGWNAEATAAWDRLNTDYDAIKSDLDKETAAVQVCAERQSGINSRLNDIDGYKPPVFNRIGRDGGTLERGPKNKEEFGGETDTEEIQALAMQGWLLNQVDESSVTEEQIEAAKKCGLKLNSRQLQISLPKNYRKVRDAWRAGDIRNALSGQVGSTGGYTFGETFVANLERAMLAFGGIMQVADVIRTTNGEPMRWPTATDTSNSGRQVGESAAVTTLDPTFGQVIWNAYKFTSDEILVPFELLRDNAINLADELSSMLGERLGRIQNTKYTTGTGAGTPKGMVTCAAAGVTTASSTAIAFDEVIDLEHSLDPSRRSLPGVGYMFHDNILKALRKLKDGEGRYLWQAGANTGAPDTLNTKPYTINQDMASAITSGAVTMLFGQFSKYKVRQVNSIRLYRLVERYRENDQDAFLAFVEGDGNLLDAGDHPVKKMVQL